MSPFQKNLSAIQICEQILLATSDEVVTRFIPDSEEISSAAKGYVARLMRALETVLIDRPKAQKGHSLPHEPSPLSRDVELTLSKLDALDCDGNSEPELFLALAIMVRERAQATLERLREEDADDTPIEIDCSREALADMMKRLFSNTENN